MKIEKKLHRCPQCKKLFALKKQQTTAVREEQVKILESATQTTPRGEVERLGNRYVDGKRVYYETTYLCRFCGAQHSETTSKDTAWKY